MAAAAGIAVAAAALLEVIAIFVLLLHRALRDIAHVLAAAILAVAALSFGIVAANLINLLHFRVGLARAGLADAGAPLFLVALGCLGLTGGLGRGSHMPSRVLAGALVAVLAPSGEEVLAHLFRLWLIRRGCGSALGAGPSRAAAAALTALGDPGLHIRLLDSALVGAAAVIAKSALAFQIVLTHFVNLFSSGSLGLLLLPLMARGRGTLGVLTLVEARVVVAVFETAALSKLTFSVLLLEVEARAARGIRDGLAF